MLNLLDDQPDLVDDLPAGAEHREVKGRSLVDGNSGGADLVDVLNDPEALRFVVGIREHAEDRVVELVDELSEVPPRVGLDLGVRVVVSRLYRPREIASRAVC